MDVIKLPEKFREIYCQIMDGKDEALDTLETFSAKYPHQVAAVQSEGAYFNFDYETALNLDLTILPFLEEWYYGNVSDEHMTAMTVSAIDLHREQELIEAFTQEQQHIHSEKGRSQRDRLGDILMDDLVLQQDGVSYDHRQWGHDRHCWRALEGGAGTAESAGMAGHAVCRGAADACSAGRLMDH